MDPPIASRTRGSIFGVAVVDALGGPVEFKTRGTFPRVTSFLPNDHFCLAPGTWTDDTSMTLCLAQSLIDHNGELVALDMVQKFVNWYQQGYMSPTGYCFDIGNSTRMALGTWKKFFAGNSITASNDTANLEEGQDWIDVSLKRKQFCGNGSLMRVAPIGLVSYLDEELAESLAFISSRVTHPYPTCSSACMAYTKLICRAMKGASKSDLAAVFSGIKFEDPDLDSRFKKYVDLDAWMTQEEKNIKSSGYVVDTLEAALWAFFTTKTFKDGAVQAVNLGHDSDTVGAVYGGLAGAFYAVDAIPSEWLENLQKRDLVERVADELASLCSRKNSS